MATSEQQAASEPDTASRPMWRYMRRLFRAGGMFSSLRIHDFRILWFGMLFAMAAMQMNMVARSWLAYDITGSGVAIGLVALSMGVPRFIAGPFAGAAADRFNKRGLLIVTQLIRAAMALAIAALITFGLIEIWHMMVIGVFQGLTSSLMMPARTAYISDLVSEGELPNAIALDSTGRNLNRIIAPAVAGVMIWLSPAIVFYVIAGLYLLGIYTVLRLPDARPDGAQVDGVLRGATRGIAYFWEQKSLLLLLGLAITLVVFGMPYRNLLPIFQKDVFDVGPSALGLMYTAVGAGAIAASLLVAYLADSPRLQLMQLIAGVSFGLALALFALSGSYILGLALLAAVGFASQVFLTINKTLLMLASDRAYYGRVMSIYMMGFSLTPIALLPMGAAVDAVGAPVTVAAAGAVVVAVITTTGAIQGVRRRGSDALLVPSR